MAPKSPVRRFLSASSVGSAETGLDFTALGTELAYYRQFFPSLSGGQFDQLVVLCQHVADWNLKVNLISRKDIASILQNHLLPSLAVSNVANFMDNDNVIDIGTGGGFPGLPLAIANPNTQFTLLDSNAKKMKVVADIASKMNLRNVNVVTSRAEAYRGQFDFLLGRAVTAIPNFLSFSSHLMKCDSRAIAEDAGSGGKGLYYLKGGEYLGELQEAGITKHSIKHVSDIVPIQSDKFVLHIASPEICRYRKNMDRIAQKKWR
eukprot:gene27805-33579_t